jgi:CubicO group peptidase (beta-lactamase class C family)
MKSYFYLACLFLLLACSSQKEPDTAQPQTRQAYASPGFAQPINEAKLAAAFPVLDKVYRNYMEKNHFPSIAYGVVANGKLVYSGSYGFTDVEKKTPSSAQAMYRIASMSKSFTAMAILKLRDDGKLSLTDPVTKYIPEFAKAGAITADAQSINIQHLMTMSAGFPEDNPWGDRQLADTDADLLELVGQGISFSNAPGQVYEYSNLGFALLGKIIGNVSGMPYQKYITDNIMKPVGMTSAKWEYNDVPADKLAYGYRWEDDQWKDEALLHDGSYGAMGGLICSIEDFGKYVALHLNAWPPRNDAETGPVKRSSIREMHQPWRFNNIFPQNKNRMGEPCPSVAGYGYGLNWRKDCTGTVRVAHSGGLPGFGSEWRIYPEFGVGVISFANLTYGAPSLANAIALDTLIQLAGLKPRALPPSEILVKRQQQIVDALQNWSDDQLGIFAENFFLDLSLDRWKAKSKKILDEAGAIKSIGDLRPENQLRGSFTIVCEKKSIEVFFTVTPEAEPLIQQLDVWM